MSEPRRSAADVTLCDLLPREIGCFCSDVCAVVVAFRPHLADLRAALRQLREQCRIVLVDNSDEEGARRRLQALALQVGAEYHAMGANKGIATAQNVGIERALQRGVDYVLLLDDDSQPDAGLVLKLRAAFVALTGAGEPVAAVGARARARSGADVSNARQASAVVTVCRDMMGSGALISATALHTVGRMEESLFIDCVDFEWGWRAQAHGFRLFLVNDCLMGHALGSGRISLGRLVLGISEPIRHYYQFRNVLDMLSRGYVPCIWKVKQVLGLIGKPVIFGLFVRPRLRRLCYMALGVRDAVLRKQGPYGK